MSESAGKSTTSRFWRWFGRSLPALVVTVIIAATQAGPDEATSRLKAWADAIGLGRPQWLTGALVLKIGVAVMVLIYGFIFRKQLGVAPQRFAAAFRAFRAPPPLPPKPTVQEVVAVEAVRASFRNAGGPAADRIHSLSQDLRRNDGKGVPFLWLLEKQEKALRETKGRLEAAVEDGAHERLPCIRQALQEFLAAYGTVVRAVHDFEKEGVDLLGKQYADAYARWEQSHTDWIQRLDTIKEQPALAHLRPAIQDNLQTGEYLRYSALFARGAGLPESASPDERAFLALFCSDTTPTNENPIEYGVYNAGRDLASKNLLKLAAGENGAQRFCLPEPVRRGWTHHGESPYPQREFVDVHPSAVIMGRAEGGGGVRP
jgi:hypothetical protein